MPIAGMVFASCSLTTEPADPAVAGTYVLTRIDGQPLPATVPLPAAFGSCVPQVVYGDLVLDPQIRDNYPFFTILIRAEPNVPPASCRGQYGSDSPQDLVRDAGRWTGDRSGLRFASKHGLGTYDVVVGDANGDPTLTATVGGHALVFQRAWTSADELVGIAFDVFDEAGARATRSVVAITRRGLVVYRAAEFGSGRAWTVARGGPLTFTVTPPPGYTVAAGQPASVTVTPTTDQRSVTVRFVLARTP